MNVLSRRQNIEWGGRRGPNLNNLTAPSQSWLIILIFSNNNEKQIFYFCPVTSDGTQRTKIVLISGHIRAKSDKKIQIQI